MARSNQAARSRQSSHQPVRSGSRRLAAIDIGSDTIHLTVAEREGGGLRHLLDRSRLLRLGLVEERKGGLPDWALASIRRTLRKFVREAREADASDILIAATAAVRDDPRHRAIAAQLSQDVGVPVRVIPKRREIELGFLAAQLYLRPAGKQMFVDSGGASTEITLCQGRTAERTVSLPIGAAKLSILLEGDPPGLLSFARLMVPIHEALQKAPLVPDLASALFSGGTAHHIFHVTGTTRQLLTRTALESGLRHLLRKRARKIARKYDLEPARVPLLIAGAVIVGAIFDFYGLERVAVTSSSVRDGMIRAETAAPGRWWKD